MKLLVVGGTGYIGQALCRAALQRGLQVTSVSRRGDPPPRHWAVDVSWQRGDVFQPHSLDALLAEAEFVVHAVGTLLEDTGYKQWKGAGTAGAAEKTSYEHMNRDSALRLAAAVAQHASIKKLLYISAASAPPMVDIRYLTTKREAERSLLAHTEFQALIFRPGFVFDPSSPASRMLACAVDRAVPFTSLAAPFISRSRLPARPISVQAIAMAAVEALIDDAVGAGVYEVADMERLAEAGERKAEATSASAG